MFAPLQWPTVLGGSDSGIGQRFVVVVVEEEGRRAARARIL